MKTVDIIPLILLELNDGDKYGIEITKNIETKSSGKIDIKQPTLYTVLKKLEKSKFITSYWEDSEIGGKRHYYKLTDNGKNQLSTFSSYEEIVKNILEAQAEEAEQNGETSPSTVETKVEPKVETKAVEPKVEVKEPEKATASVSIMDALFEDKETPSLVSDIAPAEEVFASNSIDSATSVELNQANADLLKEEKQAESDIFASNESVAKFTEMVAPTPTEKISKSISDEDLLKPTPIKHTNVEYTFGNVKYVDYKNFKSTEEYKYAKHTTNNLVKKSIITSLYLVVLVALFSVVCASLTKSSVYYISLILALTVAVFYPCFVIGNYKKLRAKLHGNKINIKMKNRLLIGILFIVLVAVTCLLVNVYLLHYTWNEVYKLTNFASLYVPILYSTFGLVDWLMCKILFKD